MEPEAGTSSGAQPDAGHGRAFALYAVMIFGGLALLQVVLGMGRGLHGPKPVGDTDLAGAGHTTTEAIVWKLLLASAVIIVVARLVGALFQRINQPQVVGEIVAGIVLGPSVLGNIWPEATKFLFSDAVLPYIDVLAQIGLIFFMFLIGLELDVRLLKGRGHAAATVSHVSIIGPFLLGAALALFLFPEMGSGKGKFTEFALFMGASMSITAFPVLARILTERGIYKTRLGAVTLTCAAIDDVTAWCMLAVVVAIARANGAASALITIGLSAGFILLMIVLVRPLLAKVAGYYDQSGQVRGGMLALLFVGVLLSALATDRIGIHAIFGAFLFGAIMPQHSDLVAELTEKLEDFTVVFLLPLFFAFNGLRTDIGLIGGSAKLWLFCGLILLVAIVGKWGGSTLAAKVMGMGWRESLGLGLLMNTRGLTELIILNIGLDLGVIPPALFAMLVIMALVTTFMTTPLLSVVYPQAEIDAAAAAEDDDEDGVRLFRILVPVANAREAQSLVLTALRLAKEEGEQAHITLLRVIDMPGSAYRAGPRVQEGRVRRATESLKPIVQLIEGAGHQAVPMVLPSNDVADTIVRVADEREPDLVLLGWHRSFWGNNILGGAVGEVMRRAKADVAVVVDPAGTGLALPKGGKIVVPYGGGFHENVGYDLAVRLADAADATVTIVGPEGSGSGGRSGAVSAVGERAAQAYEEAGVWATPVTVRGDEGDAAEAVVSASQDADLVVLGVGDEWGRNKATLGGLREAVAARSTAPILLVRRHGQKRTRRAKEWIVDTGETTVVSGSPTPDDRDGLPV
jgi:Kef-type K+ transport system membrane component KefB/nucleotide-binding universal stress UspA family protein